MLVNCNIKCHTTVDARLNVDTNDVICGECGCVLDGVSEYSKLSMKTNGDVLRSKNRKAFVFPCKTCDKQVEASFKGSVLVGKACDQEGTPCKINITTHMAKAIEETATYLGKLEEHDAAD